MLDASLVERGAGNARWLVTHVDVNLKVEVSPKMRKVETQ
jgi:hypothetical protein